MKNLYFLLTIYLLFTHSVFAEEIIEAAALMPLSGTYAPNGYYTQDGVKFAQKILEKDGIKLKVRFEDACLAKDAVTALKSLTDSPDFKGIVANYCVLSLAAMRDTLKRKQLTTFHNSIVPGNLIDNQELIYTTFPTTDEESSVIADYAYNKLEAKTAAILFLTSQWGQGYADGFKKHFEALGGEIVISEEQTIGATDFRAELSRIKNANVDVIFPVHAGSDLVLALKQIKSLGINSQIVTTSEAYDDSITNGAGNNANGLTFFIPKFNNEHRYLKRLYADNPVITKNSLRPLTTHAYVSSMAFAEGFAKCKKDKACLNRFLINEVNEIRGGNSWGPEKFQTIIVKNQGFTEVK